MDPDDTVVRLAGVTAPLPPDSGGVRTFFGISRIIDDSDSRWMGMFISYEPLKLVPHALVIPRKHGQKTLQRARRDVSRKSNRFDAFSRQVRKLTFDISPQVLPRAATAETIVKLGQKWRL
jgi:hypothetical protein